MSDFKKATLAIGFGAMLALAPAPNLHAGLSIPLAIIVDGETVDALYDVSKREVYLNKDGEKVIYVLDEESKLALEKQVHGGQIPDEYKTLHGQLKDNQETMIDR